MALVPTTEPLWQLQSLLCVRPGAGHHEGRPGSSSQSVQGVRGQSRMEGQAMEQKLVRHRGWDIITSFGVDQIVELLLNNEEG